MRIGKEGSCVGAPIALGSGEAAGELAVLELASTNVEKGGDAVDVDVEALRDQVIIGAQGSQRKA